MKCSSLIRNCFPLWYLDALLKEFIESMGALTLESWFKTSTNKKNCYLARVLLTLIWCLKEIQYLLAICLKILITQNRETTKCTSILQIMLSHKTQTIDSSYLSFNNWEWAGSINNRRIRLYRRIIISVLLILESKSLRNFRTIKWMDVIRIKVVIVSLQDSCFFIKWILCL